MAIVDVFNKQRNITYVYESTSYWDKELKQPRSHRKLIGKRDPATGEIIPTGTRGRKKSAVNSELNAEGSVSEDPQYIKALEMISHKDHIILELQQKLKDAEQENACLRQIISQASTLLASTSGKVSGTEPG